MPKARLFGILGILLLALLSGLDCPGGRHESPERIFLRDYGNTFLPLEKELGLRQWQASFSDDANVQEKLAKAEQNITDFFVGPKIFDALRALKEKKPRDPEVQRQLDILYDRHWPYQVAKPLRDAIKALEKELGQDYDRLRLNASGDVLNIEEAQKRLLVSTSSDDRQDYWEAILRSLGPLDPKFRRLIWLRNEAARTLGFEDYFDQVLSTNGVNKEEFSALLNDLEARSAPPFARVLSEASERLSRHYGVREDELRPWHWPNPFFLYKALASSPGLNRLYENRDHIHIGLDFFKALGMDLTVVVQRSELYDKKARESGAFRIFINREYDYSLLLKPIIRWEGPQGYDVRIVMNVSPSSVFMKTVLHQLGHAAYLENVDKKLPFVLRQEASIAVSESVATFFEHLIYDAAWIRTFMGIPADEVQAHQDDLRQLFVSGLLASLRQKLCLLRFEQSLYDNPEQDLNALWRRLTERFLMAESLEGWDNPDYLFYEDFVRWPIYEQHFIYAYLLCAQIRHYLEQNGALSSGEGKSPDWPAVGRFFKEKIFSLGATYPWPRLVETATGECLNPAHFFSPFADNPD
jgi:peptidyl-dipeptidase A